MCKIHSFVAVLLYLFTVGVLGLCLFFPCSLGASLVPTAKMNPVKMVEHVLTVWMVLSVSVTQVLGEKGNWLLSRFVFAPLCSFPVISRCNKTSLIWTMLLQDLNSELIMAPCRIYLFIL